MKPTFKILTLNVWMLEVMGKWIAQDISARLNSLPNAVKDVNADILCFQEVWMPGALTALKKNLTKLGYQHFSHTRARFPRGNGLLTASRYPMATSEVRELKFTRQTQWYERLVCKGAIATAIWVPHAGWVDVINTHLGSVSWDRSHHLPDPKQAEIRNEQLLELQRWIPQIRTSKTVVVAGDFNLNDLEQSTRQPDPAYLDFKKSLGYADLGSLAPTWQPTFCAKSNPYARKNSLNHAHSERLDYIFVSSDGNLSSLTGSTELTTPQNGLFLSDHFGVTGQLAVG